jgi:membrane associated rhomboid family serine protease
MDSYSFRRPYTHFGFGSHTASTVKILIIINIAVFILIHIFPRAGWILFFGLVPSFVFSKFMLWQPLTYMFLHIGLWHLVVNMLMLWFFGSAIEASWGRRQFLFFYFFTGIGAGLCSFVVSMGSGMPVVGASGAIFGILVAYAMMYPDSMILLFFIFPMKMRHAVLVLAGINLLGAISSPGSGIAYFAHLGGGLFGYLYLKNEWIRRRISYLNFSGIKSRYEQKKARKLQAAREDLNHEVDRILDKISRHGIDSLTKREKQILERKSKVG